MTEINMVERVARAIMPEAYDPLANPDGPTIRMYRKEAMGRAHAAMWAMREPTADMMMRASESRVVAERSGEVFSYGLAAKDTWQAMISAALQPTGDSPCQS